MMNVLSRKRLNIAITAALALGALGANAENTEEASTLVDAVSGGKANVSLRYRFESVDQDGIDKDAHASTLKTRLTYSTQQYKNFKVLMEFDNVSYVGNDLYNSTGNGKTEYPVVADPSGTDLNQALVQYSNSGFKATAGRQRILHGNQRFVGGVGWRQNEQTYDGYRFEYANEQINADYSYVYNVNRIVGDDHVAGDWDGDLHLANLGININKAHKVTLLHYALDFEDVAGLSSQTTGINYDGKINKLSLHLAYATQSEYADNPNSYTAAYTNIEAAYNFGAVKVTLGDEILGADDGVSFSTPLATLHKFQGFADKFLGTPGVGVDDKYIGVNGKVGKVVLGATYHVFSAEDGGDSLGTELDLVAKYKVTKNLGVLAKLANYAADDDAAEDAGFNATDTSKLWLMATLSF